MKGSMGIVLALAGILAVLVGLFFIAGRNQALSEIRGLSRKGATEQEMISTVEKTGNVYSLSADDVISLKKDGVPDTVVVAMLRHHR